MRAGRLTAGLQTPTKLCGGGHWPTPGHFCRSRCCGCFHCCHSHHHHCCCCRCNCRFYCRRHPRRYCCSRRCCGRRRQMTTWAGALGPCRQAAAGGQRKAWTAQGRVGQAKSRVTGYGTRAVESWEPSTGPPCRQHRACSLPCHQPSESLPPTRPDPRFTAQPTTEGPTHLDTLGRLARLTRRM